MQAGIGVNHRPRKHARSRPATVEPCWSLLALPNTELHRRLVVAPKVWRRIALDPNKGAQMLEGANRVLTHRAVGAERQQPAALAHDWIDQSQELGGIEVAIPFSEVQPHF